MDCLTEKIWLKANNNSSRLPQGTIEFKKRTSNEYEPIQKIKPHSSQSRLNARRTAKWYIMLSKCAKNITEVSRNKVLVCNASPKKIGDNELKSGGTGRL